MFCVEKCRKINFFMLYWWRLGMLGEHYSLSLVSLESFLVHVPLINRIFLLLFPALGVVSFAAVRLFAMKVQIVFLCVMLLIIPMIGDVARCLCTRNFSPITWVKKCKYYIYIELFLAFQISSEEYLLFTYVRIETWVNIWLICEIKLRWNQYLIISKNE